MSPKTVTAVQITDDPQTHEAQHVHAIYDQIASHFSSTRYKPWPIIAQFLSTLPTGSIGLDSGTGNGKYLPLPYDRPPGSIWTIGLDRSRNLLEIAQSAGTDQINDPQARKGKREVVWGDVVDNGWRMGAFDYAISIATIHHLASPERRKLAVQRLLQSVSSRHGRVLIYVWAIEQDELSKREVPTTKQDPDEKELPVGIETGQDVFVPWVLSTPTKSKGTTQAGAVSESNPQNFAQSSPSPEKPVVFNRYYHMFARGELVELVRSAVTGLGLQVGACPEVGGSVRTRGIEIVQDGWERSNYYVELKSWQV